ncbi:DUF4335 domain-containing protein [Oscillatoria salina]|uniref:DUF4335 domain-containing protein n=1 Tax=Oscillatoria salina TaxID=331517 RepID=UPI0013B7E001|nr:DUF4335 domain-containing protein [Oscillatoria salina]MBZ8182467.1 DUF4335 domain-containing protein [Oscillatoria salina IIICB1]NET89991.1 DUF4335 domain-containing protein [Kamptonema sp. SIO1D9]
MTIRRQYSPPNCTLILDGMSTQTSNPSPSDGRPLMSILVNAECHFTVAKQTLSGGREFFDSLVRVVSAYAQEFLSGVRQPPLAEENTELVQLTHLEDKNLHRLSCQSLQDNNSDDGLTKTVEIDLTTVELFDLVEAIDQFFADSRTLPELGLQLQPVSKRYRLAEEPIMQRAAPAAIGATSLAFAAIAFFLVPIPEVREPEPTTTEQAGTNSDTATDSNAEPITPPTPDTEPLTQEELEELLASAQEIRDPTQLSYLNRNLYQNLNQAWQDRTLSRNLEYRVSVTKDGAIVDYEPVANTPASANELTPLPELAYSQVNSGVANQEAIAPFRVVFTNRGILQVSPWQGYAGEPTLGPEITAPAQLRQLNEQLRDKLRENWDTTPIFPRALDYRVAVTAEGVIADYEFQNTPAADYVEQTPLPELVQPEAAGIGPGKGLVPQTPLAHYRVVFRPNGVIEVSPFRGF